MTNEKARCNKYGDLPDGRHVTEIENADLNVAELRIKHTAIIEHENDLTQDGAVAVRKEIIRRQRRTDSHCQSCGCEVARNADNEGYSPCCNELIISGGCDPHDCFHVA